MSDSAIKNALTRRDDLLREIDQHEKSIRAAKDELNKVLSFVEAWSDFASEHERQAVGLESNVLVTSQKPKAAANPKKEYVAEVAAQIIRERERPIGRSDLYKAMSERGIHLEGKDPEMVLSTMLWRMRKIIVRLHPYGYWVADQPYPPAGYEPGKLYDPNAAPSDERSLLD